MNFVYIELKGVLQLWGQITLHLDGRIGWRWAAVPQCPDRERGQTAASRAQLGPQANRTPRQYKSRNQRMDSWSEMAIGPS
ncbi:hypothetical protein AYI68_g6507 [Smittium mucronatum]|uniref:Uncharacterized protein n=1 Tax=Smittium mucronatum TaxID=133383 RepID=A0A1R0GRA4_9FUNG|nr:hypothetical protein AYI68_g6507 [Smittium mucronatum]